MSPVARFGILGAAALALAACSASSSAPLERPPAGRADAGADSGTATRPVDAGFASDAGSDGGTAARADAGVRDGGVACLRGVSDALYACLHRGTSPDDCVDAQGSTPLCDGDGDGVGDDLESALALEYAPVFAFNGGQYGGNAETNWPANVNHFVSHAQLFYRPPDGGSDALVDAAPTLDSLARASFWSGGLEHFADDPALGNGSDFFLCLTDTTGSTGVRVPTSQAMLALPDGVDVTTIVQPANGPLAFSTHLVLTYDLFFAYNQFATVDNHEGDWEGVQIFVNRMTGGVDSAYFGRHDTTDGTQFVDTATYPARDASAYEPSRGTNVDHSDATLHGLRFVDYGGVRHHLMAFVGTGGHAMYDYPANTYVMNGVVRDTHNGDGPKLDLAGAQLLTDGAAPQRVKLVWRNPGELGHVQQPWAEYRGQWGCQDELIAQSWPGPWGNARHPRDELERAWGSPPTAP